MLQVRFMQPERVFWTVVACHWCILVPLIHMPGPPWQGARMFRKKLTIVRSGWAAGGGYSCPHSSDLANLFCKAPPSGGQLLFHTCLEPRKSWRLQSDLINSTNQDILHVKNVWHFSIVWKVTNFGSIVTGKAVQDLLYQRNIEQAKGRSER